MNNDIDDSVPWTIELHNAEYAYVRTGPNRGLGVLSRVYAQAVVDAHNTDMRIAIIEGRHHGFN